MSQKGPAILCMAIAFGGGIDYRQKMQDIVVHLQSKGYDAKGLSLSDTPESDAEVVAALKSEYQAIAIGGGVRVVPEWHRRIVGLINDSNEANRKATIVEPNAPQEMVPRLLAAVPLPLNSETTQ